ncbi:MAG: helix-turn-helix domain-containing protein [Thermomicrobiales bacterium]
MRASRHTPSPGFGAELNRLIDARHILRDEAADRIGVDGSYISRLITGHRRPSREVCQQIADGLELTCRERRRLTVLAGFIPPDMRGLVMEITGLEAA